MKKKDGSPTICSVLRGIRQNVISHMNDRGVDIKRKTLDSIDKAIKMAKKMNLKLMYYKEKQDERD